MNFQDLRRKAESAASTARLAHSLSSSPLGQKLASSAHSQSAAERPRTPPEPVKPSLASQRGENTPSYPSQSERFANSTSLQLQASRNAPPPPPTRRVGEGGKVPPARAAKPAGLAGSSGSRGAPPPAPPPRVGSSAPPPPPVDTNSSSRPVPAPPYSATLATRPTLPTRSHIPAESSSAFGRDARRKRFDEYDQRDKEAFWEVLDEFFGSRLASTTTASSDSTAHPVPPAAPPSASTPSASTSASSSSPCTALSLLHSLLHPSPSHPSPFSTLFFLPPPQVPSHLPPFLLERGDHRTAFSWSQTSAKGMVHLGMAVCADSSVGWWKVSFDPTASREDLARGEGVEVEGRYRPPAKVEDWSAEELYTASELYGTRVAEFARRAVERGQPVGRGECWDFAHHAIESVGSDLSAQGGDPPFPSIGRAHGALLFHASSARLDSQGRVTGEWYGGDLYVREGDVVEWRRVRICEVGGREGSYCLLGDPEHTAIVLTPHPPSSPPSLPPSPPYLDQSYPLSSLSALTVAEQSLSHPPSIRTYDLRTMDEGEVWIYRPVGMRRLTGVEKVETGWEELDRGSVEYRVVR